MLEIIFTSKILGPSEIGGPRLKPFQPNGKFAPAYLSLCQDAIRSWNHFAFIRMAFTF